MKILIRYILILPVLFFFINTQAQHKILIVTGGHDFEKQAYYDMFDSFKDIDYDTISQPGGNELIATRAIEKYDCIVFYDMYQIITESQKDAYMQLLKNGKGMVFTHHALVSYQDWPEFEKIVGGKYHLQASGTHEASTYRHDVDFIIEIADDSHMITQGMHNFQIHDEVYGKYSVGNYVKPLLTTSHPESTSVMGWYHQYEHARIVYLQPGHDHYAYQNENYRLLLHRAIVWASVSP